MRPWPMPSTAPPAARSLGSVRGSAPARGVDPLRCRCSDLAWPTVSDRLRAYWFALDVTSDQEVAAVQHAGAARGAYNHALAAKLAAYAERRDVIGQLVAAGVDPRNCARRSG